MNDDAMSTVELMAVVCRRNIEAKYQIYRLDWVVSTGNRRVGVQCEVGDSRGRNDVCAASRG